VSAPRPSLFDQVEQVVCPVVLSHPARIDEVSEIVFGVGENKRRVTDFIVFTRECCFSGKWNPRTPLGRVDGDFASCEPDKTLVKMVEPRAQHFWIVTCGVSRNKNYLDLIRKPLGNLLKTASDIRHVQWTLTWAMGISEKEERDVPIGLLPEIERG